MAYHGYRPTNPGWGAAATWAKRQKKKKQNKSKPLSEWESFVKEYTETMKVQREAILRQQAAYEAELRKRAQFEAEKGRALGEYLTKMNIPGVIQGVYGNAAKDIAGFAQGFSGNIRTQADAQAQEQINMLKGTGQEGAVRNEGEGMANVAYGVGGAIPGTNLTEQAAGFAAEAALAPQFAARIGQLEGSRLYQEGLSGLDQFTQALAELEGNSATELMTLKREYDTEQRDFKAKQKQQIWENQRQILKEERDWYRQQAQLANLRSDNERADEYLALANAREERIRLGDMGFDANGNLKPGYTIQAGQVIPPGYRYNRKTGQVERITKGSKSKPKKNKYEIDKEEIQRAADNIEDTIKSFLDEDGKPKPGATKWQVYTRLWTLYRNLVKTSNGHNDLKRLILSLMKQYGFGNPNPTWNNRPEEGNQRSGGGDQSTGTTPSAPAAPSGGGNKVPPA